MPKNEASKTASEPRLITTLTDHPISPQVRQVGVTDPSYPSLQNVDHQIVGFGEPARWAQGAHVGGASAKVESEI